MFYNLLNQPSTRTLQEPNLLPPFEVRVKSYPEETLFARIYAGEEEQRNLKIAFCNPFAIPGKQGRGSGPSITCMNSISSTLNPDASTFVVHDRNGFFLVMNIDEYFIYSNPHVYHARSCLH
jgi:hypothetical protein